MSPQKNKPPPLRPPRQTLTRWKKGQVYGTAAELFVPRERRWKGRAGERWRGWGRGALFFFFFGGECFFCFEGGVFFWEGGGVYVFFFFWGGCEKENAENPRALYVFVPKNLQLWFWRKTFFGEKTFGHGGCWGRPSHQGNVDIVVFWSRLLADKRELPHVFDFRGCWSFFLPKAMLSEASQLPRKMPRLLCRLAGPWSFGCAPPEGVWRCFLKAFSIFEYCWPFKEAFHFLLIC